MTDVLAIFLLADERHAGALASLDLILQAGPRTIAKVVVIALPYLKGFLQQIETFADGTGAGIRTEVAPLPSLLSTVNGQSRILILS
jgi:hypothetical protein